MVDYPVIHWIDHVRAFVTGCSRDEVEPIIPLLQTFFVRYWNIPPEDSPLKTASTHDISKLRNTFQALERSPQIIHKLVALSSVPLICDGSTSLAFGTLACTKLGKITQRVRSALEHLFVASPESRKADLEMYYGTRCFKCPEEDCAYFSEGFSTRQARDEHGKKHNRSFFCPEPGCHMSTISCSSASALKVHIEKDHQSTTPGLPSQSGHRSTRLRDPTMSTITQNIIGPRIAETTPKFPSLNGPQPLEDRPTWLKFGYDYAEDEFPVDELGLAPDKTKKLGDHWCAVFNPDIPRTLDVERLHTVNSYCMKASFSHDGQFLAIGMEIFNVGTGALVTSVHCSTLDEDISVQYCCFSPDDRYLATGHESGLLKAGLHISLFIL